MQVVQSAASQTNLSKTNEAYIKNIYASIADEKSRRRNELLSISDINDSINNDDYPTLYRINKIARCDGVAEAVVIAHLRDFVNFCSFSEPVSEEQFIYISRLIVSKYGYLKMREIMIFFAKLKSGDYGVFYGKFDALIFMRNLSQFIDWRNSRIDEYIKAKDLQKTHEGTVGAISLQEYLKINPNSKLKNFFNNE